MAGKDYYKLLRVGKEATREEIIDPSKKSTAESVSRYVKKFIVSKRVPLKL